jgi:integrase
MTPHRPGWATEWWRNIRDDYGMAGVRLHDLRHYHVTWLLSKGVGIKEVSERVGHSLTSTTQNIYQHSTPAGQAAAVKALAAIGGSGE